MSDMQWWPLAFHDHNMQKNDRTCARVPLSPVPPPPVMKGFTIKTEKHVSKIADICESQIQLLMGGKVTPQ